MKNEMVLADSSSNSGILPGFETFYRTSGFKKPLRIYPESPENTTPYSNLLSRVSLFVPVRPGRRKKLVNAKLHAPDGTTVLFTGEQFNIADQDCFLSILGAAQNQPGNTTIAKSGREWLALCGLNSFGRNAYDWFKSSLARLRFGQIFVKTLQFEASFQLISEFSYHPKASQLELTVSNNALAMFHNGHSYINLVRRGMLEKRVEMAKCLQCYICGHKKGALHETTVENLHALMDSNTRQNDFRKALGEALGELQRVGELTRFEIQKYGIVTWMRPYSEALYDYS